MKLLSLLTKFHTASRFATTGLLTLMLTACGGGGGSPGVSGGGSSSTTTNGSVTVTLTDTTGVAKTVVSGGSPLVAKALVKNAQGTVVQNALVTFTVSSGVAVLSPTAGTALTDSNGIAQIGLEAGAGEGAGEITASATVTGTTAATGKAAFTVGAAQSATPAAINFVEASPTDKSIVIQGAGGNGRTEVALLTFKVVDSSNSGVANKKVVFSLQSNSSVTLVGADSTGKASSTTGQNGEVTATLNSGALPTTVRVIATVDGTSISTISDTVTVTTGQPIQAAFSLSVETFNISGWNHDNEKTKINILIADQSGNPVADGTPVVFQTDSGAVGSSDLGGCHTVNGACSVDFRSQDPRYGVGNTAGKTPGIATITASSTSGTANLMDQIEVILSADDPFLFMNNVALTSYDFSTSNCNDYVLNIEIRDVNSNPMPKGTKVEAVNLTDVTISEISNAPIGNASTPTTHRIPIKPDATKCAAGGGHIGTFDLKISSPMGNPVAYPFSLTFP